LLGSGRIYDGESLEQVDTLPYEIADADWLYGELHTIRDNLDSSVVEVWGGNYGLEGAYQVPGEPVALRRTLGTLLIITSVDGVPRFYIFDPDSPGGDSDNDGYLDQFDNCPDDPLKVEPGICGCGVRDIDSQ
jgi:hypothetical protein